MTGNEVVITDAASALDLMMTIKYETGCSRIAIEKACVDEPFFILSTQLAGEILQKFINYQAKLQSMATIPSIQVSRSRTLSMRSNKGNDFFFVATQDEAVEKLSLAE